MKSGGGRYLHLKQLPKYIYIYIFFSFSLKNILFLKMEFNMKVLLQANPSLVMIHVTVYGPVLAECLKDGSMPVRLAAERCALHALQLTKGIEI